MYADQIRAYGAEEPAYTRPCTPETPILTSTPSQLMQATEHGNESTRLDGGIRPEVCESGGIRLRETDRLESPTSQQTANIRIRRSNCGSKLLQSPARPGFASRMQQLFEDAGSDHQEQRKNTAILYPQLPNISRKAAPSLTNSTVVVQRTHMQASPRYRPESLCLSTNLPVAVSSIDAPHVSLIHPSSGSWSDDSGYFVTTRARSGSCTIESIERVHTWLLELPDPDEDAGTIDTMEERKLTMTHLQKPVEQVARLDGLSQEDDAKSSSSMEDPFVCDRDALSHPEAIDNRSATQCIGYRPLRDISDVCKPLHLDHLSQVHTSTVAKVINVSPEDRGNVRGTRVWCNESEVFEEGGIQLSPLSPNVCIERGPSRYHSPRKHHDMSNATTPSKTRPTSLFQLPRLKENVVLQPHDFNETNGPVTPRINRLGTRFIRRPI
jgi:hypothetical protein